MHRFRRSFLSILPALSVIALGCALIAAKAAAAPLDPGTERAFAYEALTGPEIATAAAGDIGLARARAIGAVEGAADVSATTLEDAQARMEGAPQPLAERAQAPPGLDAWLASAVDLVVLHGHFTDTHAKVPPGSPAPTGTVLEYAVDAHTGRVVGVHLGGVQPATAAAARAGRLERLALPYRRSYRHARAHAASWSNGCEQRNAHHCYAIAYWPMSGNERVRGTESDIATDAMNVPGWQNGAFVDNEKWTLFPQYKNANGSYWVEDGQEGGNYVDCCSLRWFTAWNNGSGYGANESPWNEPGWTFVKYQTVSQLNGSWCFYVEAGSAGCVGGFPAYSTELQVGAEDNTSSEPENNMFEQSNGTWTDGSVHPWNFAGVFNNPRMCVLEYSREHPPHYYPGNIEAWDC